MASPVAGLRSLGKSQPDCGIREIRHRRVSFPAGLLCYGRAKSVKARFGWNDLQISGGNDVSMQDLFVSMMRFSAALTLYGLEQAQSTMNVVEGGEDLSKSVKKLEQTLNSMTDALITRMDSKKKDTLKSVTKVSEDVVNRTWDSMNLMDPREVLRATNDLIQKTSDATADWVSKAADTVEKATDSSKTSKKAESA
jgi:hypothetical protein